MRVFFIIERWRPFLTAEIASLAIYRSKWIIDSWDPHSSYRYIDIKDCRVKRLNVGILCYRTKLSKMDCYNNIIRSSNQQSFQNELFDITFERKYTAFLNDWRYWSSVFVIIRPVHNFIFTKYYSIYIHFTIITRTSVWRTWNCVFFTVNMSQAM